MYSGINKEHLKILTPPLYQWCFEWWKRAEWTADLAGTTSCQSLHVLQHFLKTSRTWCACSHNGSRFSERQRRDAPARCRSPRGRSHSHPGPGPTPKCILLSDASPCHFVISEFRKTGACSRTNNTCTREHVCAVYVSPGRVGLVRMMNKSIKLNGQISRSMLAASRQKNVQRSVHGRGKPPRRRTRQRAQAHSGAYQRPRCQLATQAQ